MANDFWAQYKHPNWQKRRLERLEYCDWGCENCGVKDETLHVHHKQYFRGRKVWEYGDEELTVLCEGCHQSEHAIADCIKRLLIGTNSVEAFCILGGFNHASDHIDRDIIDEARAIGPLNYACGLIAYLSSYLSIYQMRKVAEFAVSLANENSEARPILNSSMHVFGEED